MKGPSLSLGHNGDGSASSHVLHLTDTFSSPSCNLRGPCSSLSHSIKAPCLNKLKGSSSYLFQNLKGLPSSLFLNLKCPPFEMVHPRSFFYAPNSLMMGPSSSHFHPWRVCLNPFPSLLRDHLHFTSLPHLQKAVVFFLILQWPQTIPILRLRWTIFTPVIPSEGSNIITWFVIWKVHRYSSLALWSVNRTSVFLPHTHPYSILRQIIFVPP